MSPKRKFWGWGIEGEGPPPERLAMVEAGLSHWLNMGKLEITEPPQLSDIDLPAPRFQLPATLKELGHSDDYERLSHCYGKSYRDIARAFARKFEHPPDVVAYPKDEADVVRLLDFCTQERVAVIPYGGGSSVCGGVEAKFEGDYRGALSLDLTKLDQVLKVDRDSRAAQIQGGVLGPALEAQLKPHGLTLRHYPQSFEFSSLGGWIATRAGGHFATQFTHIDDFVESLRVVTPRGTLETRRLPGSGAGPSPDRLFIGSEGALGVITSAWMRVQDRPRFRANAAVRFADFASGARALKALVQSGLYPANCRLLDPMEALMNQADGSGEALLLVAFESADHSLEAWIRRAVELVRDHGGRIDDDKVRLSETKPEDDAKREGAQAAWRDAFLRAPYLRDALIARGVFTETFETAVTWDRFDELYHAVSDAARKATAETGGEGVCTCRVTHAYPDGAAPYFTVVAPARRGSELQQWDVVKAAMTDAMLEHGGTVTHHHAVGRDFMPWYLKQQPPLFGDALSAAKRSLDPALVMNPSVLVPTQA
ncbi:MAG: FAD-binding oxidoreductase [Polyangiaceae bacterium]|nr:FAD-binding oxidoreductase [Polyangiaceae bacterium]